MKNHIDKGDNMTNQTVNAVYQNIVGETLSEILADRGLSARDLALQSNIEEQHIHDIIAGRRMVSDAYAEGFERVLGIDRSFWLNLQRQNPQWGLWGL
jgi:addiction module HigA family antidote